MQQAVGVGANNIVEEKGPMVVKFIYQLDWVMGAQIFG